MTIKRRLVARLDIKGNRLIKGVRFEGLRVVGDPSELIEKYLKAGIDELFYSDAVASLYGRNSLEGILREACKKCFVPITAGGGIRSVEDGKRLLAAGADKLAINTAAAKNPTLLKQLSDRFGRQCVVLSVQARRKLGDKTGWEVMLSSGREKTSLDLKEWINKAVKYGAGEVFVTSVDQDGTQSGPDDELIKFVSNFIEVPLVVCGGFNSYESISKNFKNDNVSAIAIGSSLHNDNIKIKELKKKLLENRIAIRYQENIELKIEKKILDIENRDTILVIDYGMGNIQSLMNALKILNYKPILSSDIDLIKKSNLVILPGVGSFPAGMRELKDRNLIPVLRERAFNKNPILGICLGMQLLFKSSTEIDFTLGLDLLKGKVINLKDAENIYKIDQNIQTPNIGWNNINKIEIHNKKEANSFTEFLKNEYYFVHSYGIDIAHSKDLDFAAKINDLPFMALALKDKLCGIQFHPERSGNEGLSFLDNIIKFLNKKR